MQIKKVVCVLFLFAALGTSKLALAEDRSSQDTELEQLKQQIAELQKQMLEMKGKHDSEINVLKNKIKELSERAGAVEEVEPEDELAANF